MPEASRERINMAEPELAPKFAPFFGMVCPSVFFKTPANVVSCQGGIALAVSGLILLLLILPMLMHYR